MILNTDETLNDICYSWGSENSFTKGTQVYVQLLLTVEKLLGKFTVPKRQYSLDTLVENVTELSFWTNSIFLRFSARMVQACICHICHPSQKEKTEWYNWDLNLRVPDSSFCRGLLGNKKH